MTTLIRHFSLAAFLLIFAANSLAAQEIWSLERCVQTAVTNNRTVKQSDLLVRGEQLTLQLNKAARLPSLTGQGNMGGQFGFSIDPATNAVVSQAVGINSWSLNSGITLYNGGQIQKSIQQSGYNIQASEAEAQATRNTLALQVASSYLQILLSEEQLSSAKKRLELSNQQLERTEKLIKAGTLAPNSRYDFLAQIARDEQSVVSAENTVDIAYLTIKILMELDPDFNLKVERPTVTIPVANPNNFGLKAIYTQALGTQPQVRAGELRLKSANTGVLIANAAKMPTISAYAQLDTRYSTLGMRADEDVPPTINNTTVVIQNNEIEIGFYQPVLEKMPYFNQIGQNFGQAIGLSLQVPILTNGRNSVNIQRAELAVQQQELANLQTQQQLKGDIQTAIANARAAQKQFDAAQKTFDATKTAYENADRRFAVGAINAFELTTARNNMDTSEINLILAKYDYIFRQKIIEFYEGKTMKL